MNEQDRMPTPFEEMGAYWRGSVKRPFWIFMVIFLVLCALFGAVFAAVPDEAGEILESILEEKEDLFLEAEAEEYVIEEGYTLEEYLSEMIRNEDMQSGRDDLTWDDVWRAFGKKDAPERTSKAPVYVKESGIVSLNPLGLFINNSLACLIGVLLGLVPFLFLPLIPLIANAMVVGMAVGAGIGQMGVGTVLASLLPHGIVEIPAMVMSFALGFSLCKHITGRIFRRPKARPLFAIKQTARIYIKVVLPMLIAAAVIEAMVTPFIAA